MYTKQGVVTELVRKSAQKFLFSIVLAIVSLVAVFNGLTSLLYRSNLLITPKGSITVETVKDEESRRLGLSNRSKIDDGRGMLFEFHEESEQHCFWMKDMHFSIDMIWLDSLKRVVHIEEDVSPGTYPKSFCSDKPALYVLEVGAGQGNELGIIESSTLQW